MCTYWTYTVDGCSFPDSAAGAAHSQVCHCVAHACRSHPYCRTAAAARAAKDAEEKAIADLARRGYTDSVLRALRNLDPEKLNYEV